VSATPAASDTASRAQVADDEPLTRVGHAFKAAMVAVRRLRGRETQRLGKLSYAQYSLLFGLADEPALSGSQLACIADLSPATVTQMLDHLEADGLVNRVRSDRDKRVVLTSLTARGRRLVEQQRASLGGRWQAALAEFDDEQLASAAAVLDRIAKLFDEFVEA
jgi:MarR family transcriptional regulator, organic hydroperoxide resistance regulator